METIILERRWFKDESEFEWICKNLGLTGIEDIRTINITVESVEAED